MPVLSSRRAKRSSIRSYWNNAKSHKKFHVKHLFLYILSSRALKEKLPGAVIGACLNNNLIEKNQESIHPVLHAVMEAAKGAKVNAVLEQNNYQLKIAIVREGHWIAVAMYGKLGFHELSDHHTIGCGIHIIP